MSHEFEVYADRANKYRWRLVAQNGEIVADSGEGYGSESDAREAVSRVQSAAADARVPRYDVEHFEIFEDRAGEYRWRLVASNGRIIADSGEGYGSKSDAREAAVAVSNQVTDADVAD
jgi:uncharacterized protein YegP (UPF0339 family)